MICPVCHGEGIISKLHKSAMLEIKKDAMKKMKKNGYTYREIAKYFDYKSPDTVWKYVNEKEK